VPEAPLTPERRRAEGGALPPPTRAPFVELGLVSCFSFLRGASDAVDLATTARALGYDALGIADANTMAGVVRLHGEAKTLGLTPVIGCRIETTEGLAFLAYPRSRAAYGRLCRLISAGRMGKLDGEWQDKGICDISLAMLADHAEGVALVLIPPTDLAAQFTVAVESNVVPFVSRPRVLPSASPRTGSAAEGRRREEERDTSHEDTKTQSDRAAPQAFSPVSTSPRALDSELKAAVPQTKPLRVFVSSCESFSNLLPHLIRATSHPAPYRRQPISTAATTLPGSRRSMPGAGSILATNDVLYHAPSAVRCRM
jgi:hypothetical protein